DDVIRVVHEVFGQVAVAEVDPPLVVDLLLSEIVAPNHVVERTAGTPHRAGNQVARFNLGHLLANVFDLTETFVPDHQVLAPRRRVAVKRLVDLAVGRVHSNLKDLHQYRSALGNSADVRMRLVRERWNRDVAQMDRVRRARQYGNGLHGTLTPRSRPP